MRVPQAWLQTTWPAYRWITGGPRRYPIPAALRARIAWPSFWASANWRLSRRLLEQLNGRAPQVEDPILIVGPWRSGTTIMHELLVAVTGLSAPQTWQCMNASSFVLTRSPGDGQAVQRPMDQMMVRADSPQEDEFALLTLGIRSAYLAFLRPDRMADLEATLDQQLWLRDSRWCDVWVRFLRAVLCTLSEGRQPLILKSPNHTYRLRGILARFPGAKLIWMMRDPLDTFYSNLRMWNSMFALYGLTTTEQERLDTFLVTALSNAAEVLSWCCSLLPPSQFAVVSADHLLHEPAATLCAVCDRLALSHHARELPQRSSPELRSDAQHRRELSAAAMNAITRLREAYAYASEKFEARP